MKARILYKDPWFYVQTEEYNQDYSGSWYEWRFVTDGFLGLRKRKFPGYVFAKEYIESYNNSNPDYLLVEEIER